MARISFGAGYTQEVIPTIIPYDYMTFGWVGNIVWGMGDDIRGK